MNNISTKIDAIIALRKQNLDKVSALSNNMKNYYQTVKKFKRLQDGMKNPETAAKYLQLFKNNPEVLDKILNISVTEFDSEYQNYMKKLQQLQKRFERKELHISFIGSAGQGKSLVMQNISGLNGNIIPSAEGGDCTGAKSIITNDSNAVSTHAEIEFFSEVELVNIVNKYLNAIFHGKYTISSIYDIKSLDANALQKELDYTMVDENKLMKQLEKYIIHLNEFEQDLGKKINVSENDIEQYVAQYKNGDVNTKYYKYLGVKTANIICRFPHEDAGKIVLVDTIGIGATSLGTEDEMLDTVENDSDAIVFMFRPEALRPRLSNTEVKIVEEVSKRVSPQYSKEMMFWILNKVQSGKAMNTKCIPEIKNQIKEMNFPIADVLEVDCMNKDEVENQLLVPILNQLTNRINVVDNLLIQRLNTFGERLFDEYQKICNGIDKVLVGSANEDAKRAFWSDIKGTFQVKLLNSLRDLYLNKYRALCDKPCEELQAVSKEKLKNIFKFVPSKEEVIEMLNNGTINQHNGIENCTDIMRIKIIDDFMELDGVLNNIVMNMKKEVLNILADEDKGRLGYIVSIEGKTPDEWIEAFIQKTECDKKDNYKYIYNALTHFHDFKISVQGFLIHEVRIQLEPIDFSLRGQMPQVYSDLSHKDLVADDIRTWLNTYTELVFDGIEKALNKLYSIPNRAMFAAIKDLYDRATYSGKFDDVSVTTQWRYLYEDWMSVIWSDKYKAQSSLKQSLEEWDDITVELKKYNKIECFCIQ